MDKQHTHYFKIINHELFGGEGSEGYIALGLTDKEDNPIDITKNSLSLTTALDGVEVIEISEKEYLEATEEEYSE